MAKGKKDGSETRSKRGRSKLVPLRLGEKLRQIRLNTGLTQGKIIRLVNPLETDEYNRARISQYEKGKRIPSLIEVWNYAKIAKIRVEVLLDDNLDLPDK